MTDKEVQGRTESMLFFFFQMPNVKCAIASSVYYMCLILTYLLAKQKNGIQYFGSEMLQKEIDRSYSTFPNDIVFAKLRTGTRENLTGERRSGAFINI